MSFLSLRSEITKTLAFTYRNFTMMRRNVFMMADVFYWPFIAVLSIGFQGLIGRIGERLARLSADEPGGQEKRHFLAALQIVAEAYIDLSTRYADAALELARHAPDVASTSGAGIPSAHVARPAGAGIPSATEWRPTSDEEAPARSSRVGTKSMT